VNLLAQGFEHRLADVGGRLYNVDATLRHDLHLGFSGIFFSTYDGAGVAHGPALRSRLTGDEADYGLSAVFLNVVSCFGFHGSSDLADHYDGVGVGVFHEELDSFLGGGADDGVTADSDTGRLAHSDLRDLVNSFVGQRTGAGDDTDTAGIVDEAGHDTTLRLTGRHDAGAVILYGNAFGNADDNLDPRSSGFHDGVAGESRWYENDRYVGVYLLDGLLNGVENGNTHGFLPALTGGDTAYEVRRENHLPYR